jgi:hypothetical protein
MNLQATLEQGSFALVVAAPELSPPVRRVLEYLNQRGLRLFGLEVSYFAGPVECFVPRLVVAPPSTRERRDETVALDLDGFLGSVRDDRRAMVADLLEACVEAGAQVSWKAYGPSITVRRNQTRQVAWLTANQIGITVTASGGFPQERFDNAKTKLEATAAGALTSTGWSYNIRLADASDEQLEAAFAALIDLCRDLSETITYEKLDPVVEVEFSRNDYNVWERVAPALAPLNGRHLKGVIKRQTSEASADVLLVPLRRGSPGWVPRFETEDERGAVWPPGVYDGEPYELTIHSASP